MSRFTIGDRVQTPADGIGLVKTVWPKGQGAQAIYAVEVDNRAAAVVLEDRELRAAPPLGSGNYVCCRDCSNGGKTHYVTNAVRCQQFLQLRSAGAPRICRHFTVRLTILKEK